MKEMMKEKDNRKEVKWKREREVGERGEMKDNRVYERWNKREEWEIERWKIIEDERDELRGVGEFWSFEECRVPLTWNNRSVQKFRFDRNTWNLMTVYCFY